MNFRRWQMHAEIPSAPGNWEVYYPTQAGERRKRFGTEEQAQRFAEKMGGKVVAVAPKSRAGFMLRPCR